MELGLDSSKEGTLYGRLVATALNELKEQNGNQEANYTYSGSLYFYTRL